MVESDAGGFKVKCSCGTVLNVPATAVGRKAKCPTCQRVFDVPASPRVGPGEPPLVGPSSGDSLHYDLAGQDQPPDMAHSPVGSTPTAHCPRCGADMPDGAVFSVRMTKISFTGPSQKLYQKKPCDLS